MIESGFINGDCMDYLKEYPDNYFDLCIADPPYGDAMKSGGGGTDSVRGSTVTKRTHYTFGLRKKDRNYKNRRNMGDKIRKKIITWDVAPEKSFFDEIFRISRNQIIWGGNYFELPPTRCFLIWRKLTISEKFSMAMAEYAWTSFNLNAKVYEHTPQDPTGQRFHPTEKPLDLYMWIIENYAKPGDKILDPMAGSANSLRACRLTGHDYVGFEIDPEYYEKAKARLEADKAQMNIFDYLKGDKN
jgi:site-specific DNA-methyltransferase (adenine-specific)